MKQPLSMAHVIGGFFKFLAIFAPLALSALLSYLFFTTIAPPDKWWFPYFAMGLTEGGLVLWFVVFLLMRHEPFSKAWAMLMVIACGIASFIVAGTELHILFTSATGVTDNTDVYNTVQIVLEIMFGMHLLVALVEAFHYYFSQPGNSFFAVQSGNLIPKSGNLIPQNAYSIQELQQMQSSITGQIEAMQTQGGASEESPLEYHPVMLSQVGTAISEGVSSLIKKGRDAVGSGNRAGRVHGKTNETTSENT